MNHRFSGPGWPNKEVYRRGSLGDCALTDYFFGFALTPGGWCVGIFVLMRRLFLDCVLRPGSPVSGHPWEIEYPPTS